MPKADQDRLGAHLRLEWISLVYLAIFALAVMSPSIVQSSHFGIPENHLEEILIFVFGLVGLGTFSVYERLMEKRLEERDEALSQAQGAVNELLESYKYIGSINRQLDVLKTLVNQTSLSIVGKEAYEKDLMRAILNNAAVSIKARGAFLRFLELDKLRTEREYFHDDLNGKTVRVANKELKNLQHYGAPYALMRTEDGHEILAVPSDRKDSPVKAYLLLFAEADKLTDVEISLLKVFANQAELVHHQLTGKRSGAELAPLDKVRAVADMAVGDVS
jgi:hypothetical protein